MTQREPILIPLEEARELVYPHELADVLQTLWDAEAITGFLIGRDLVEIVPHPEKRFDVALLAREAAVPHANDGRRKSK